MSFPFDELKATQAAAWLVSRAGGDMNGLKLSKLLYMADREALKRWGRPIIGGKYSSMRCGPVISSVVDRLKPVTKRDPYPVWDEHFQREGTSIILKKHPGRGRLHEAAINLLDELFLDCGNLTQWEIKDKTHRFPEYNDPKGSSRLINLDKILEAVGKNESEIRTLTNDSRELCQLKNLIGC